MTPTVKRALSEFVDAFLLKPQTLATCRLRMPGTVRMQACWDRVSILSETVMALPVLHVDSLGSCIREAVLALEHTENSIMYRWPSYDFVLAMQGDALLGMIREADRANFDNVRVESQPDIFDHAESLLVHNYR